MECLQFAGSTPVSRVILMCAGRSLRGVVAVKHSKSCLKLYLCRRITKKHFDLSPCMYSTVQNLASNRCGASDLCLAGPSWHAMVIVAHTAQRPKSRWVSTALMPIHLHTWVLFIMYIIMLTVGGAGGVGKMDGCATFWRSSMLVKRSESVVSYDDVARAQVRTARRTFSSLLVAE